ncbi:MAG: Glu/Leu/Phe/Val dehydrogenase dimerization domain-containing protein [Pseudomonadota bacterium]
MKTTVLDVPGWQQVTLFEEVSSGLRAIVSVHDATLGPACGGCRVFPYDSLEAGLADVNNLARGMTYKNALGGIPFGGGKCVVFADPHTDKTPAMMRALGQAIDSLNGLYYTAEDSGMSEADIATIREVTPFAAGMRRSGVGGNPSPFTARGVWRGIEAAVRHRLGRSSLDGLTVGILGVGAVGMALAKHLHGAGAKLLVADVNVAALARAHQDFGAQIVSIDDIYDQPMDVFAPCALGGSINPQTVHRLKASVIAGAANNQLVTPPMGTILHQRDILYAPDYVVNAAGVISVGLEIQGTWTDAALTDRIDGIGETLDHLFQRAKAENRPTHEIADMMAQDVIDKGAGRRTA